MRTSPSSQYALEFERKAKELDSSVSFPGLNVDLFGPRTIEGYITPFKAVDKGQAEGSFFQVDHGGGQLAMMVDTDGWSFRFRAHDRDGKAVNPTITHEAPVRLGKKTHVALVFTGRQFRLFLDGKTAATKDVSDLSFTKTKGPLFLGYAAHRCLIGEVRLSKIARYDADFMPAQRFEPDADTLALYHFDEGKGEVLKDASGNFRHGTIVGAKWVKADGSALVPTPPPPASQYAVECDWQDNKFNYLVRVPTYLDFFDPRTIEAYVTLQDKKLSQGSCVIAWNGVFVMGVEDGRWQFTFRADDRDGKPINIRVPSAVPVAVGKKTHVAVVFSGREFRLFVDGEIAAAKDVSDLTFTKRRLDNAGKAIWPPTGGMNLGYGLKKGLLRAVRISNVARYDKEFTPPERFEPDRDTRLLYQFDEGQGTVLNDSSGNGHHGGIVGLKWVTAEATAAPTPPAPTAKQ
jgi:hypothetical protein